MKQIIQTEAATLKAVDPPATINCLSRTENTASITILPREHEIHTKHIVRNQTPTHQRQRNDENKKDKKKKKQIRGRAIIIQLLEHILCTLNNSTIPKRISEIR
jgi:hypothetical protein